MNEASIKEIEATRNPKLEFDDKGFFVIYVKDDEIIAEHYQNVTHSNDTVETGKVDTMVVGKAALAMCHTIMREELVSRLEHAAYIGRELQKAEFAIDNDLEYVQDEELKLNVAK